MKVRPTQPMSSCPSQPPLKPESIAKNPAADGEWDRIVSEVGERGNWEDTVWTRWLEDTCLYYADIAALTHELNGLRRGPHTAELAHLLSDTVNVYSRYVAEFLVSPGPLVRLKDLSSGDA